MCPGLSSVGVSPLGCAFVSHKLPVYNQLYSHTAGENQPKTGYLPVFTHKNVCVCPSGLLFDLCGLCVFLDV